MKFAAIDIGSNAIRLLFVNVHKEGDKTLYHKISLMRSPVRLGADTFIKGYITKERKSDFIKTMVAFKNLIDVYKVDDFVCCATSAMRDASNGIEIAQEAGEIAGFKIQIISGEQEAKAIYATHIADELDPLKFYLYIDVGGGSTELSLFNRGKLLASESFRIGTIRVLEQITQPEEWERMKDFILKNCPKTNLFEAIGTGGNINKIYKLANKKDGKPLTTKDLQKSTEYLTTYTYDERVNLLGLREDRADVIIPAAEIYLYVLQQTGIKKMFVPKLGLADGLIHQMYDKKLRAIEVATQQ